MADSKDKLVRTPIAGHSKKHSAEARREIAKRLYALSEATGEACSAERADIYTQALADLEPEKLMAVLESMLQTAKWFPKIPEIREAVLGNAGEKSWEIIASRVNGWRDRMQFSDDVVASGFSCGREIATFDLSGLDPVAKLTLRRLGGARSLACANPAHLPLIKKDFVEGYKAVVIEHPHLLEAGDDAEILKQLVGAGESKDVNARES